MTTHDSFDRDRLARTLHAEEGYRPNVYRDSRGYQTIGIGRLVDGRKAGGGLTLDEALYLLGNDIDEKTAELDHRLPWWRALSEPWQRALIDMSFQLGVLGVCGFRNMLAALERGDGPEAKRQALDSRWARQTPNRARRVAALLD